MFARVGRTLLPAPLVLVASAGSHASPPVETRLAASVDDGLARGLALLERVVNVNSGTMNFEGVREVGTIFRKELEGLGFSARWVDGAGWGRAGHLLAERPGGPGGLKVLFIGHLDTVFEADSPFQRYEALGDSAARGPGTIDMKGGAVVLLLALHSLAEAGVLDRFSMAVYLGGDEEKPGSPLELARRDLSGLAPGAEIVLGFEDGAGDPRTAVISRRGVSSWTLEVSGHPAHSSQIFTTDVGSGAIFEAARILAAFHDSLSGEAYLTLSPGLILGGTTVDPDPSGGRGTAFGKTNVVPGSAVVTGDLRALSLEQRDRAQARMEQIVATSYPGTKAKLTFVDEYPPLAPSEGNRALLALFDQVSRDLGQGPVTAVDPARAGAADISFTAGTIPAAMDGVGLMGSGGHTIEETADLRTLPMQAKRVAVTLWRLAESRAPAR